jgi:hypothetical protein
MKIRSRYIRYGLMTIILAQVIYLALGLGARHSRLTARLAAWRVYGDCSRPVNFPALWGR